MPWGGGNYLFGVDTSRTTTNSLISSLNPSLSARLQVAFSQPLLRDFKIDATRARGRHRAAEPVDRRHAALEERGEHTSSRRSRPYWSLVAAIALVDVQQRALDLALELERTNRARVDVGQSPPLDLVAARAEVAQRRENLIVARTLSRQAEDRLRTLIVDPKRDGLLERPARAGRSGAAGRAGAGCRRRRPPRAGRAHRSGPRAQGDRDQRHRDRAGEERDQAGPAAAGELPDRRRRRHAAAADRRVPRHDRRVGGDVATATSSARCSGSTIRRGRSG